MTKSQSKAQSQTKKKNHRFYESSSLTSERSPLHNLIVNLMGSSSSWGWLGQEIQRIVLPFVPYGTLLYIFNTLSFKKHFFLENTKYMRLGNINRQTYSKNKASDRRLNKILTKVFTKLCTFKARSVINKFSDNKISSNIRIQFNKAEFTLFLSDLPGNRLAGYLNCSNKGPEECTHWSVGPGKYCQRKVCRKISVEPPLFEEAITQHLNLKKGLLCI